MRRFLLLAALLPGLAAADVRYTLTPEPAAKQVRISMTLEEAKTREEFRIPAWCPGFYFLLNYHEKISDFRAVDPSGQELEVQHSKEGDPRAWYVVNPAGTPITVSYRVLGDDPGLGFFRVNVQPHTAFINGPAAFMYSPGHMTETARLKVDVPAGWQVATPMDVDKAPASYVAGGYDELIDHPIQVGKFERRSFTVEGIPFEAVYVSPNQQYSPDLNAETERLRKLSIPAIKMMGGAPFKRYLYLIHLSIGDFSGGLEHRAANVMAVSNRKNLGIDDLAAHEYFHAWNVKQIRPLPLGPFDYTRPVRTGNLWFSEGVTDYYSKLHTYQSGLGDVGWLFDDLSGQIASLERGRTRLTKTVEDASREAWENGGFGVGDLSYYTKGLILGLIFDATIRSNTNGRKSLDDVLRLMYTRHRLPKPGFAEDGVLATLNEVAGKDLTALYTKMARTTEPVPYELLSQIGLRLIKPNQTYSSIGFTVTDGLAKGVSEQSQQAGLRPGDKVLSIGGAEFKGIASLRLASPDMFKVVIEREGVSHSMTLPVVRLTSRGYQLEPDPFATPEAVALREAWLQRLGRVEDSDDKGSHRDQ
jgi:predicted metalloprotease with PDZ domain